MSKVKTAVLLSGGCTTLQNLIDLAAAGELPIEVTVVIASKAGAYGLERARQAGIEASELPRKSHPDSASWSAAVNEALAPHAPELVLMAGLIHLWLMPEAYAGKVMNIHPSLIPAFCGKGMYDLRVHQAVVAAGVKHSGCTVQFADQAYDTGPIILQRTVPVRFEDTPTDVRDRVQAAEREAYPEAIRLFAAGRLQLDGRRVRVTEGA